MRHLPFCHKINLNQNDSFCGLMPPTPALPFLLREKEAKAYLRGFPLDIPWGLCPRSNRKAVTLPLIYYESLEHHWGIEGGRAPFCWKSKNQEVFGVSLPTFFTQESRRGVERAAPQKTHPIKHKKIPAQIMQGFFIYPSLSKQLSPDLWHQRVFTHRYIVTKVFCLFSVP